MMHVRTVRRAFTTAGLLATALLLAACVPTATTIYGFGANGFGQVGDGSTTTRTSPVVTTGLTSVTALVGGESNSVALKADGTVWTWGSNSFGQLGNGSPTSSISTVPVQASISGVTAISAGNAHVLALKSDGTVWAWGYNANGRLGDGTTTNRTAPVQVSGLADIVAIGAGYDASYAIRRDPRPPNTTYLYSWGYNLYGALGLGTTSGTHYSPALVNGVGGTGNLTGVSAVAGGLQYAVVLRSDGTLATMGTNTAGQLASSCATLESANPCTALTSSGTPFGSVTKIAAGFDTAHAIRSDGTVWGWGYNNKDEIGDGTTTQRNRPVPATAVTGAASIASGPSSTHTLVLTTAGDLWAWGNNINGALGFGDTTNRSTPTLNTGPGITKVIGAGWRHSLIGT